MACQPLSVTFELDFSPDGKITLSLDKICKNDQASWLVSFEVEEGSPLATVASLNFELDPENFLSAEETTRNGLDPVQEAQAEVAACVVKKPDATDDDKRIAIKQIIAVRTTGTGPR